MTKPAPDSPPQRRIDRILAFMALGLTGLSIICFFTTMLATPMGVTDYSEGIWPAVIMLPLIALPIAFVLIFTLLILSFVRRSRAGSDS